MLNYWTCSITQEAESFDWTSFSAKYIDVLFFFLVNIRFMGTATTHCVNLPFTISSANIFPSIETISSTKDEVDIFKLNQTVSLW